jgi:hypothetical protein
MNIQADTHMNGDKTENEGRYTDRTERDTEDRVNVQTYRLSGHIGR